jgi:NADPH:quinone reductase-like Zn-dependent oxidoreductase
VGRAQAPGGASNEALFARYDRGDFRVVLDAQSPLPFTEEGVKAAYRLLASRRAKGKIVIEISQPAA